MNDINRRGFLGTLIASVAALFAGKRTEASANDIGKHVEQPAFQRGDIVLFDTCYASGDKVFCGVVLDWSDHAYFDRNYRVYRVDTPHGLLCLFPDLSVQTPTYGAVKISHVDRTDPGAWSMYGSKDGKHQAILCKPTQSVKAGQLLAHCHFRDIINGESWDEIGPTPWVASNVLGFATSDVTVLQDYAGGNDARPSRDWCWVVPQMEKPEAWDAAETYWYKNQQELGL